MRYLALILCVMLLAGCGTNDSSSDVQPTAIIEDINTQPTDLAVAEEPTPVIFVRNTLPPTWTPVFEPEQESWIEETPTPEQVSDDQQIDGVRAEWTPVFVPTFVSDCQNFSVVEVESEQRFVEVGYQPILTWHGFDGIALYRLRVFNESGTDVYSLLVKENSHQLPETVFDVDGVYGWTVTPLDRLGFPMCGEFGDYFIVGDI